MNTGQKISLSVLALAALGGLLDSAYLYFEHLTASSINCFLFDGCNTVAASPLSRPFGVPLSLIGIVFFGGMLLLTGGYIKWKHGMLKNLIILGAVIAFLLSLYFTYLQGFVIQAFCIYCLISAAASTIILCAAVYIREHPLVGKEAVDN